MKNGMTKEEARLAIDQWKEAVSKERVVTCPCGNKLPIQFLYKCLYCGLWFCKTCAEKHFGKTREEWKREHS